jgi:serine protease
MRKHGQPRVPMSLIKAAILLVAASVGGVGVPASTIAMAGGPAAATASTTRDLTDRIIVKFRDRALARARVLGADTIGALSQRAGMPLAHIRVMSGDAQVLALPARMPLAEVEALTKSLAVDPVVEYAEPDRRMFIALVPNDALYGNQWHYKAPGVEIGGANLPLAWDITTGSASIVVAVIDTGLRPHADIDSNILDGSGRVVPGYDFIHDPLVANDGDGGDADPTSDRDADPSDPGDWITAAENAGGYFMGCGVSNSSWHGTHVAGTIGALSNNATGVAGVNWNAKILPVRVLGKCGGYESDIIEGMRWAAGLAVPDVPPNANPAKVLNLSLGGPGQCSTTAQNAINDITAAGAVVVVAAGNAGVNLNTSPGSPANCNGVITVAANDRSANKATYSNYGSVVKITAPGGGSGNGVLSTVNSGTTVPSGDAYASYQGTSMAAPHVAGIASLAVSLSPTLTPPQVLSFIQTTARAFPVGSTCNTSICGSGIIDAAAVATAVRNATPTVDAGADQAVDPGAAVIISGSATPAGGTTITGYLWSQIGQPAVTLSGANTQSATFTAPNALGTLAFQLLATGSNGYSGADTVNVTINNVPPTLNLSPAGNPTVTELGAVTIVASGTDANGTTPTLSATNLPTGATFNAATGTFNWPSAGPAGSYTITFSASDGVNPAVTRDVTVTVQALTAAPGSGGGGGCFIATAAYGTSMASDVRYLRAFRDQYLLTNAIGRGFVKAYYTVSPPLADFLRDNAFLRAWVRLWLKPWVDLSRLLVSDQAYQVQTADRP